MHMYEKKKKAPPFKLTIQKFRLKCKNLTLISEDYVSFQLLVEGGAQYPEWNI